MKNGRCRMHGGASTGPRTEAGLARVRAARTTHGGYSAESQAVLRRSAAFIAETRALLALLRRDDVRGELAEMVGRGGAVRGNSPCTVRNEAG
jgi:hypothetical protein